MSTTPNAPAGSTVSPLRLLPLLAVAGFASQVSIRLADPMLPQLAADFATGVPALSGVITAFSMAYGLMQLFFGPVADRFGKLRVIGVAAWAAAAGSAACALAGGPASLTALRLLTGAACAGLIPLTVAWIGDNVPYESRQPVLARFMIGTTLGNVFGQVMGGLFSDTIGWRMTFLVPSLLFAIVALLLGWQLRSGRAGSPSAAGAGTGTSANPIVAFAQVLRSPWARVVLALVFIEGALAFSTLALLPSWLHSRHGLSLWQTGMAAAGFGLGGLLYAMCGSWLVRRLGEQRLALIGAVPLCVGFWLLGSSSWMLETAKCLVAGLGFFMVHGTLQTVATQML
nr:MFS transporter [Burkholderiaceae bacterium]